MMMETNKGITPIQKSEEAIVYKIGSKYDLYGIGLL